MIKIVNFIKRLFSPLIATFANYKILSCEQGQWKSIINYVPLASDGRPLPWYTYPAIEYLRSFDFSARSVFEYGSGNSTLFWASRALKVCSVESDSIWYQRLRSIVPKNSTLYNESEESSYVDSVLKADFVPDVIVIDGSWRMDCAKKSVSIIGDGGMIILDNSDWHQNTCDFLRNAGFFQIDFSGFGPINGYSWTTSIFIKSGNALQSGYANPSPIGGIKHVETEVA